MTINSEIDMPKKVKPANQQNQNYSDTDDSEELNATGDRDGAMSEEDVMVDEEMSNIYGQSRETHQHFSTIGKVQHHEEESMVQNSEHSGADDDMDAALKKEMEAC